MARPAIGANVGLSVALEATPRATCRAMSPNRGTRDLSQLPTGRPLLYRLRIHDNEGWGKVRNLLNSW